MREKIKSDYGIKHIYKYYKENYKYPLEYKSFSKILERFNQLLIEEIYNGSYIALPYNLGDMYIIKYKKKIKFDENGNIIHDPSMVDNKLTKELWNEYPELTRKQYVYYDNFHSDKYRFKIKWKRYNTLRMHRLYNFKPARAFSRGLAKHIKSNPNQNYYGS